MFAVGVLALLYGIGAPGVDAQNNGATPWGGTVEVAPASLTIRAGHSVSYRLRLTEQPTADGWWVRVRADGAVRADGNYQGLSWVPSVGWEFDQDNWDQWREIRITAADDAELDTQVTFTHEVWDHTAECPVHDAGPVTARVSNNSGTTNPPPEDSLTRPDNSQTPPTDPPALTGPPTLAIDDVSVAENEGRAVFRVSLRRASNEAVTVQYATFDGTATASADYTPMSATLTFEPGDTRTTLAVPVLDDDEAEGDEVFTVRLSDARNATLVDREGTATIRDDEYRDRQSARAIPTDWLGQFGGTAAAHVVDALDERMRCARDRRPGEAAADHPAPRWRCAQYPGPAPPATNGTNGRRLDELPNLEWTDERGSRMSLWGRGAFSRFEDADDAQAPDGSVRSATVGADFLAQRALIGVAVSHSQGAGTVAPDGTELEASSSLTGIYPYLRVGVGDRLSLWGAGGIGSGTLALKSREAAPDAAPNDTGITMKLGAAGALAEILAPDQGNGLALTVKADALLLRIDADASTSFAAASADATRVRVVLEGGYEHAPESGELIAPFVDVGMRHDGGDVESGFGAEIGGGLRYAHRVHHVTAELHARALLVHAAEGLRRWSVAGSLRYDPQLNSARGPYFTFSSSRESAGRDGQATPWALDTRVALPPGDGAASGWNLAGEFGYGIPFPDGSTTGTPWVGVSMAEGTPEYRLGYRLDFDSGLRTGISGTLRDRPTASEPPDYAVNLMLSLQ